MEWQKIDEARLQGNDYSPVFAQPQLAVDQRLGQQSQSFSIFFDTSEGQETYSTTSLDEFRRFELGSRWVLNINTFGTVLSVEPAP